MRNTFPVQKIEDWFLKTKRSLPWREKITPYRVWVSEVMLQQTRVPVVLISVLDGAFPTIEALARAPLEDVIKLWKGLVIILEHAICMQGHNLLLRTIEVLFQIATKSSLK